MRALHEFLSKPRHLTRVGIVWVVIATILGGILLDIQIAEAYEVEVEEAAPVVAPRKEVRIEVVYNWGKARVLKEIETAANKYGTSYEQMKNTVACESGFKVDIQSHHNLSYGREQSYGLAQWHIPAKNRNAEGKVITKEMALDPVQALDAMAYHFSIGNAKAWTCYRELYL